MTIIATETRVKNGIEKPDTMTTAREIAIKPTKTATEDIGSIETMIVRTKAVRIQLKSDIVKNQVTKEIVVNMTLQGDIVTSSGVVRMMAKKGVETEIVTTNESEETVKTEVTKKVETKRNDDIEGIAKRKDTKAAGTTMNEDVQVNEEKTKIKLVKATEMTEKEIGKTEMRNGMVDVEMTREATKTNQVETVRVEETENIERRDVIAEIERKGRKMNKNHPREGTKYAIYDPGIESSGRDQRNVSKNRKVKCSNPYTLIVLVEQ